MTKAHDEKMQAAREFRDGMKRRSKNEVFAIYVSDCCRRIHSADIKEQRKSWMIHDIIAAHFGLEVAARVCK